MEEIIRGRIQGGLLAADIVIGAGTLFFITSTRRYLFLLRDNGSYSGTWGLVGGKINKEESLLAGLRREIIEEIGFFPESRTVPIEQFTSDNERFVYHTFLSVVSEEFIPKLNHEHTGYCWVRLEDHPKPLHPGVWKTFNFESVISKIKTASTIDLLPQQTVDSLSDDNSDI